MGSISLLLPDPHPPGEIYFAGGYDMAPLPIDAITEENHFIIRRDDADSGFVMAPWNIPNHGKLTLSTATLRQRAESYRLLVELVRGKLNSLRNQTAEWSEIGLELTSSYRNSLSDLNKRFAKLATDEDLVKSNKDASLILSDLVQLADQLVEAYTDQVFRTRHQNESRIRTAFGSRLSEKPPEGVADEIYRQTFNAVRLQPNWREIERHQGEFDWSSFDSLVAWAITAGLNVSVGPILDLRPGFLPEWLKEWYGDWPSIAAYACEFAELTMVRYGERIGIWEVVSGFNHSDYAGLVEDDRLRLAARLLDAARQIDNEGELIIGISQPWGEYRQRPDANYSPLLFADTLIRAGIRASGFLLDICEVGPSPSMGRDSLDIVKLLDNFGSLGLPLELLMSSPIVGTGDTTNRASRIAAVATCMPHLRGVYWRDWQNAQTGVITPEGVASNLQKKFFSLRTNHLA